MHTKMQILWTFVALVSLIQGAYGDTITVNNATTKTTQQPTSSVTKSTIPTSTSTPASTAKPSQPSTTNNSNETLKQPTSQTTKLVESNTGTTGITGTGTTFTTPTPQAIDTTSNKDDTQSSTVLNDTFVSTTQMTTKVNTPVSETQFSSRSATEPHTTVPTGLEDQTSSTTNLNSQNSTIAGMNPTTGMNVSAGLNTSTNLNTTADPNTTTGLNHQSTTATDQGNHTKNITTSKNITESVSERKGISNTMSTTAIARATQGNGEGTTQSSITRKSQTPSVSRKVPEPKTIYSKNVAANKTGEKLERICSELMEIINATGSCTLAKHKTNGHFKYNLEMIVDPRKENAMSEEIPMTSIAIAASCGALALILIAFAVYCSYHHLSYRKNQQHLTEELQTVENGYHDNPTLEVMEVQPETQEKKLVLNGEFNDSWIVPFDTLAKDDMPDEEDTHL